MTHIFTYGSLMFADVWNDVVGQAYHSRKALVTGYQRRAVVNETYPAMIPAEQADIVKGLLYFDVCDADVAILDKFEGDYYQRVETKCEVDGQGVVTCETYLFRPDYLHLVDKHLWDVERFAQQGIIKFRKLYSGFTDNS